MNRLLRILRALGAALILLVGSAYALASWDWCGDWVRSAPELASSASAEGPLRAGAAQVEIVPPLPIVAAGYAPPRPELTRVERALMARAVVLEVGALRVGIVSLDLLSASDDLVEAIRQAARGRVDLQDVWVVATHSHSSMGGHDSRLVAEVAGIGGYREEAKGALVDAASRALGEAAARLEPAELRVGEAELPGLVRARSGDAADSRFTRLVLAGASREVAELWIWSAHPTLVPRPVTGLSPDYPGWLSTDEVPVLLLQGAVGNASALVPEGGGAAPARYAKALSDAAHGVAVSSEGSTSTSTTMGISKVRVSLPHPDASRLVPGPIRNAGENLLCGSAAHGAEVSALRLGPLTLVALPAESSFGAAKSLEARSGATRVLSVANGYLGYLEPDEVVSAGRGEAKRQYYGPELYDALADGADLAVRSCRGEARPSAARKSQFE